MRLIINVLFILVIILFGSVSAQDEETLFGTIEAVNWDGDGKVSAIALIITSEEEDDQGKITTYTEEYTIEDDMNGKMLFKLVGKTVEVKAVFLEDDEGNVYLKVNSYKLIEPTEEDFEEAEEEPVK